MRAYPLHGKVTRCYDRVTTMQGVMDLKHETSMVREPCYEPIRDGATIRGELNITIYGDIDNMQNYMDQYN